MFLPSRRELLTTTAVALLVAPQIARAAIVKGGLPWTPGAGDPPTIVRPGPWLYFTADGRRAARIAPVRRFP